MRRVLVVIAFVGILLLAGCSGAGSGIEAEAESEPESEPEPAPDEAAESDSESDTDPQTPVDGDGELEIHHIDVGQADSTLLLTPDGETVLIDTGDWRQDGSGVIAYLDAHEIDRIDHLVSTHAHADHIGGHAAIIEAFETNRDGIGAIYDSGITHTSQTYQNYLDAVDEHDVDLFVVEEGDELPIENERLSGLVVNPPAGESGDDLHYNSVSIVFEFGEVRYLTTGDAETDAEERMVEAWADELDVDIYQAGHHGSSTSSTPLFIDAVAPKIAIISSDVDSQYGHPHDEVLEAFAERDIETYWTGVHGDIVLTTDGSEIDIETTEAFSTDPTELLAAKSNTDDTDDTDSYSIALPSVPIVTVEG